MQAGAPRLFLQSGAGSTPDGAHHDSSLQFGHLFNMAEVTLSEPGLLAPTAKTVKSPVEDGLT
jgi:hypothetical protein